MKLAFCLFRYFPYGGLQRDFLRIAQECVKRGHEVEVYTANWEGEREPNIKVEIIPLAAKQNHTRALQFAEKLQFFLKVRSYDLVIGFNKMPGLDVYYAADVCYQDRIRKTHSWFYRLLPRYHAYVALEEAVFRRDSLTQILVISPFQEKIFQDCYQTSSERFHLLPPGIDRARLAKAAPRQSKNYFHLLMVGSGFKTKGVDRSIRALAALPSQLQQKCRLTIIGQDNPLDFIKLAQQLKINDKVFFLGGRDDVPSWLNQADLLLHPAYHENTGTVLLEALAMGLPVVTVANCGYAHYVQEANAGVVMAEPFQQEAFNQVLAGLIESPTLSTWRKNALEFVKHTDIESMIDRAVDKIELFGARRATLFTS